MTTLATLKARIALDLDDTAGAYSGDITDAITRAIEEYQPIRFDFNETRDETFATVEDQQIYTESDDAAIPLFYALDGVTITVGGQVRKLGLMDHMEIEYLSDNSASKGEPYGYSYFDKSIRVYPIPDQAYTVRLVGHIQKAAPASDDETGNVWMVQAYQLIRYAAKRFLAIDVMDDEALAARMSSAEQREYMRLLGQSAARIGSGMIVPTEF